MNTGPDCANTGRPGEEGGEPIPSHRLGETPRWESEHVALLGCTAHRTAYRTARRTRAPLLRSQSALLVVESRSGSNALRPMQLAARRLKYQSPCACMHLWVWVSLTEFATRYRKKLSRPLKKLHLPGYGMTGHGPKTRAPSWPRGPPTRPQLHGTAELFPVDLCVGDGGRYSVLYQLADQDVISSFTSSGGDQNRRSVILMICGAMMLWPFLSDCSLPPISPPVETCQQHRRPLPGPETRILFALAKGAETGCDHCQKHHGHATIAGSKQLP